VGDTVSVVGIGWALLEVALAVLLVVRVRRLVRRARELRAGGAAAPEAVEVALGEVLHAPRLAAFFVTEVRAVWLALTGWFRRPPADGYSFHRACRWTIVVGTLSFLLVVETAGLHVLISRWSPLAAWIATGLSIYALLWIAGDTHALRLSRLRVTPEALLVEIGLRWRAVVPLAAIASVAPLDARLPKAPDVLRGELLHPAVLVTLREPVRARGPLGTVRSVTSISLGLDDPAGFRRALAEAIG
jgi:hypothetical protein